MSRSAFRLWLSILVSCSSANVLHAQEEIYGPEERDFLLTLQGSYRYSDLGDDGSADEQEIFQARVGVGYFQTRVHELGLDFLPTLTRSEAGGDSQDVYFGPYYNYNWWPSTKTSFHAGPHLGLTYIDASGSSSDSAFSWGAQIGMRYWLTPDVSLNVEPRLTFTESSDFSDDQQSLEILFGISVGL